MDTEIQSSGDALKAVEAIRAWTRTKLPEKQPQPWNGHSPEQCMLINVQGGLLTATYNLNRYEEILKSMAGKAPSMEPKGPKSADASSNPKSVSGEQGGQA